MTDLLTRNTIDLAGHDFRENPEAAMGAALRDVAYWGVGHLTHAVDTDSLREVFDRPVEPKYVHIDHRLKLDGQLDGLLDVMKGFIARPDDIKLNACLTHRDGTEGLHRDGGFPLAVVDGLLESTHRQGVRLITQLGGPKALFAAVTNNPSIRKRLPSEGQDIDTFNPYVATEKTKYIVAPYLKGSVIIVPQSRDYPLQIATTTPSVYDPSMGEKASVEHPFHAGIQDDPSAGYRSLFVVDLKIGLDNYLTGVDIPYGRVRHVP